jgi:nitronate monooxygenase
LRWLSDARYVAALVNSGCMGFITPRSFADLAAFRDELRLCGELTEGKPFGVNLTLSGRPTDNEQVPQWLDTALAHGVRMFETAGNAPAQLVQAIHRESGIVIHKASSLRHALAAERAGVDAVAVVGMEEGGHPGMNELPGSLLGALASQRVKVPVALGGGIGSGQQLLAALAQGLDGVVIGSRFLVCEEINAHRAYKEHLITCDEHSTVRLLHSLGNTWRVLANDTAREIAAIEKGGATDYGAYGDLISGTTARDHCYRHGDWQRGMLSLGPAIAFANQIQPLKEIVDCLMADAVAALSRLKSLSPRTPTSIRRSAPSLGHHTREVLLGADMTDEEDDSLERVSASKWI